MSSVLIKQLSIVVTIAVWFNVSHGNDIGCVLHAPMLLKPNKNRLEVYGEDESGSKWLQMMIMFARKPQVDRVRTAYILTKPDVDTQSNDYNYPQSYDDSQPNDFTYPQSYDDSQSPPFIYPQPYDYSQSPPFIYPQPYDYSQSPPINSNDDVDKCKLAAMSTPTQTCREGFIQLPPGKCYKFVTENLTWANAKAECNKMEATLAHPMNLDPQNQAIATHLRDNYNHLSRGWFIGGTDKDHEGKWIWSDINCPIEHTDYYPTQPDNTGNYEHCLHYTLHNNEFKWNDIDCEYIFPFVCQQ